MNKIQLKIHHIATDLYCFFEKKELQRKLENLDERKRIFFFCTPTHSNLGDQAQLLCWLNLFKEWHPDYDVVCVPTLLRQFKTLRTIKSKLKTTDKIIIHSGYLLYDPHPELPFILDVIRAFYDFPITILQQTVNFQNEWYRHIVSEQFKNHNDLTLVCRDNISFEKSKTLFPNVKLKLLPDVVTSLIGRPEYQCNNSDRNGIMICVRNDGEKFYSYEEIAELKCRFAKNRVNITDTSIIAFEWEWNNNREKLIRKMLRKISEYKVIITDRYHGLIFSQIVNTPVIVLSSKDHKLKSGVDWFPKDVFKENMQYASNLQEAFDAASRILKGYSVQSINPPYFKELYFKDSFLR